MAIETMETIFDEYMRHDIDSITAIERLEKYCGLSSKEAENIIDAWDSDKADQKLNSQ